MEQGTNARLLCALRQGDWNSPDVADVDAPHRLPHCVEPDVVLHRVRAQHLLDEGPVDLGSHPDSRRILRDVGSI
jgi:hypothetical protein